VPVLLYEARAPSSGQRASVPAPRSSSNEQCGRYSSTRVAEPFYKVVFEGAWAEANPLSLSRPDLHELKVGDTIPVVLSFERFESDPRLRVAETIGSIDDFAKLDADHRNAAIEDLRRHRATRAVKGHPPAREPGKTLRDFALSDA
jgi:hypothetical protein